MKISLINFRIHKSLKIHFSEGINLIYGQNTSGKTSILEAISLLSVGRSLRGAKLDSMVSQDCDYFAIEFSGLCEIYASFTRSTNRLSFDKNKMCKSSFIKKYPIFILVPDFVYSFAHEKKYRRMFLDRLVATVDDSHLKTYLEYEKYKKYRSELINNAVTDENIFESIEKLIAQHSWEIEEKRNQFIEKLSNQPKIGDVQISTSSAHHLYEKNKYINSLKSEMQKNRGSGCFSGAHKTEVLIKIKAIPFDYSSNAEKFFAISSIIVSASSIQEKSIILFDDIFGFFDKQYTNKVLHLLSDTFYTIVTHHSDIDSIKSKTKLYYIGL